MLIYVLQCPPFYLISIIHVTEVICSTVGKVVAPLKPAYPTTEHQEVGIHRWTEMCNAFS
jgi:hypothetical protein